MPPSYEEFFFSTQSSIVELETFELSHSAFTTTYRFVRNASDGLTALDENGISREYEYYPAKIVPLGENGSMDQELRITLGDLGEIIPVELDAVNATDTWEEKPILVYRTYRSDDLTVPMFGPVILKVANFSFNEKGTSFNATAEALNTLATGITFDYDNYPGLRGFL